MAEIVKDSEWYYKKSVIGDTVKVTKIVVAKKCSRCGVEFSYDANGRKNVYTAKYCAACLPIVKREQTRERVKRCRARKQNR